MREAIGYVSIKKVYAVNIISGTSLCVCIFNPCLLMTYYL